MYFEELKAEIRKIYEDKARKEKEHDDQVKAVEKELFDLNEAKAKALKECDDETFVKMGGLIAVNEAKAIRIRNEKAFIVTNEMIDDVYEKANEYYEKEVTKRINDIFKITDKMLKDADEIEALYGDYEEIITMINGLNVGGKLVNDRFTSRGDIVTLKRVLEKAIEPLCTEPTGTHSIRSVACRFPHDAK